MENLGIDYKLLIAQIINFAILFFIFRKFMAKPFMKYLKEEQGKDKEKLRLEEDLKTKHERMLEEEKLLRKKMKKEQEDIIAKTKSSAEKLRIELVESAKSEAADTIAKGKKQVEEERENFYKEVKKYIADTSVFIIEKALKKHLTTDVQKDLTVHVLSNLKKNGKYEN